MTKLGSLRIPRRIQLVNLLQHDRLWVRLVSAAATAFVLFYLAWGIGYSLLPEGVLRGWLPAGNLNLDTSGIPTLAAQIFLYNLGIPGGLTVVASWVHVGRYSLGYNIPFLNVVLYGLVLGSNSLALPMPVRLAPTLAVLCQRSGPMEMMAYIIMAAVLARTGRIRQEGLMGGHAYRIPPEERQPLGLREYVLLLAAAALLAVAAWREAAMLWERITPGS